MSSYTVSRKQLVVGYNRSSGGKPLNANFVAPMTSGVPLGVTTVCTLVSHPGSTVAPPTITGYLTTTPILGGGYVYRFAPTGLAGFSGTGSGKTVYSFPTTLKTYSHVYSRWTATFNSGTADIGSAGAMRISVDGTQLEIIITLYHDLIPAEAIMVTF